MPRPQCTVCEEIEDSALYRCVTCGKTFHEGLCGNTLPKIFEYKPVDADDQRRGQFAGGRAETPDITKATCAICLSLVPKNRDERITLLNHQRNDRIEAERRKAESLQRAEMLRSNMGDTEAAKRSHDEAIKRREAHLRTIKQQDLQVAIADAEKELTRATNVMSQIEKRKHETLDRRERTINENNRMIETLSRLEPESRSAKLRESESVEALRKAKSAAQDAMKLHAVARAEADAASTCVASIDERKAECEDWFTDNERNLCAIESDLRRIELDVLGRSAEERLLRDKIHSLRRQLRDLS